MSKSPWVQAAEFMKRSAFLSLSLSLALDSRTVVQRTRVPSGQPAAGRLLLLLLTCGGDTAPCDAGPRAPPSAADDGYIRFSEHARMCRRWRGTGAAPAVGADNPLNLISRACAKTRIRMICSFLHEVNGRSIEGDVYYV